MFELPTLLITGAEGQAGYEIAAFAQEEGFRVVALPRGALDVLDEKALDQAMTEHAPAYVINAAATFDHDLHVNAAGAGRLARVCSRRGIAMVHLSCADVFEGAGAAPFSERAQVKPDSDHSRSKWAGEEAVRETLERHVILRTGWLFSARGRSPVLSILEQARTQERMVLCEDAIGAPTSGLDLARVVLAIVKQLDCGCDNWGTYHYTGAEPINWYGFGEAIIAAARQYEDLRVSELVPVSGRSFNGRALAADGRLQCDKIRSAFGIHQRSWRLGLMRVMRRLYG